MIKEFKNGDSVYFLKRYSGIWQINSGQIIGKLYSGQTRYRILYCTSVIENDVFDDKVFEDEKLALEMEQKLNYPIFKRAVQDLNIQRDREYIEKENKISKNWFDEIVKIFKK